MTVCLGWGSLIWDPKRLPVEGVWHPDGPALPIEFSRVSGRNRLTLVVTEDVPLVTVLWAQLAVPSLEEAVRVLAEREGTPATNIGFWSRDNSSRHPHVQTVGAWAAHHDLDAVVWTALQPGFPESRGITPTREQVLQHLRALQGTDREDAEEYIRRAPVQIATPHRAVIENELGWTAVGLLRQNSK